MNVGARYLANLDEWEKIEDNVDVVALSDRELNVAAECDVTITESLSRTVVTGHGPVEVRVEISVRRPTLDWKDIK
jgi:hypothetical protein